VRTSADQSGRNASASAIHNSVSRNVELYSTHVSRNAENTCNYLVVGGGPSVLA
jgi:hypothetical protein